MEKSRLEVIEQKLDELAGKEEKKKSFNFWIPFMAKVGKNRAKKGWATYLVIKENRNIAFEKHPIDEQTVIVDGTPRITTADDVLFYRNKPFVILPNWSVKPFSPTENYNDTMKAQYSSQGSKLLLNRMKKETVENKKTVSGFTIFIILTGIVILGYFAYQGGWFS